MSETKSLEEFMDELYATDPSNSAGANWHDAPVLNDDDDGEALDLDTVIEEFIGRVGAAVSK